MNAPIFIVPLVSLFLLSCTSEREQPEQLATQLNAEVHDRAYASYCSSERSKYEDFMRDLNKAAHAEFCRVRGDCCCTGAEFPPANFLAADGRKLLTIDTLDIGTPDFYNQHTRILIPRKEKDLLKSILRNF